MKNSGIVPSHLADRLMLNAGLFRLSALTSQKEMRWFMSISDAASFATSMIMENTAKWNFGKPVFDHLRQKNLSASNHTDAYLIFLHNLV